MRCVHAPVASRQRLSKFDNIEAEMISTMLDDADPEKDPRLRPKNQSFTGDAKTLVKEAPVLREEAVGRRKAFEVGLDRRLRKDVLLVEQDLRSEMDRTEINNLEDKLNRCLIQARPCASTRLLGPARSSGQATVASCEGQALPLDPERIKTDPASRRAPNSRGARRPRSQAVTATESNGAVPGWKGREGVSLQRPATTATRTRSCGWRRAASPLLSSHTFAAAEKQNPSSQVAESKTSGGQKALGLGGGSWLSVPRPSTHLVQKKLHDLHSPRTSSNRRAASPHLPPPPLKPSKWPSGQRQREQEKREAVDRARLQEEEMDKEREKLRHRRIERGREEAEHRTRSAMQLDLENPCRTLYQECWREGAAGSDETFLTGGNPSIYTPLSTYNKSPGILPRPDTVPTLMGASASSPVPLLGRRERARRGDHEQTPEPPRPHTSMGFAASTRSLKSQNQEPEQYTPGETWRGDAARDGAALPAKTTACSDSDVSGSEYAVVQGHLAHAIYTQRRARFAQVKLRIDRLFQRFAVQVGAAGAKQHVVERSKAAIEAVHASVGRAPSDGPEETTDICPPHAMPGGVDCEESDEEDIEPLPLSLINKEKVARMEKLLKQRLQADEKEEARRKWREARRQSESQKVGVTFAGLTKMLLHANITSLSRQQLAHIFVTARSTARLEGSSSLPHSSGRAARAGATFSRSPSLTRRQSEESALADSKQADELLAGMFVFQQQRGAPQPVEREQEGGGGGGAGGACRSARPGKALGGAEPLTLEADEFRVALFLIASACQKTSK